VKRLFLVKTGERAIDIAEMMIGGFPRSGETGRNFAYRKLYTQ